MKRAILSRRMSTSTARSSTTPRIPITPAPPAWAVWRLNPASATPLDSIMLKNQSDLPKLPIPKLDVTVAKLIKSCQALANDDKELAVVKQKAEKFLAKGGIGEALQKRLEARRETEGVRSWIAEWWDQLAYFTYRDSVVVNVSYYYGFEKFPQGPPGQPAPTSDPAYVAASIVATSLEFRRLVVHGLLEPEKAGKDAELCMESYKWAFNACRVPASPSDYAVKISETAPEAQTMVVIYKNKFYSVPLYDAAGREFGVQEFKRAFEEIYKKGSDVAPGVGILTGVNRDLWAEAHTHLMENPTNAATLQEIRDSAFVITLDEATPSSAGDAALTDFSTKIWKAGEKGSEGEGANRWWDKPLQWMIFKNGEVGFVGEHSCMDGTPTARMCDFISKRLITNQPVAIGANDAAPTSTPSQTLLPFELDSKSLGYIKTATKEFQDHVGGFDLLHTSYERYGKEGIKQMKTSPDGWVQMMFQLAYFMTHGKTCGTYEAAQVRRFQLGRTETIRTATPESAAFTAAMLDPKVPDQERFALFQTAVKIQGEDVRNASVAMGIDRHLFGLRNLVQEGEDAELLKDPLVGRSSTWNMSTSQIFIKHAPAYGWGPVTHDGYGLPYMVHDNRLQLTVTCRTHMPGQTFLNNLEKAGDMLMEMAQSAAKQSKL